MNIKQISDRLGIKSKPVKDGWKANCPFHNDRTPSFIMYSSTNTFCCFGSCNSDKIGYNTGDTVELVKQFYRFATRREAYVWIEDNFSNFFNDREEKLPLITSEKKILPPQLVVYWHKLLDESNQRKYFHERLINDNLINKELWGWDGSRYTLPVWEDEPQNSPCIGVRRRKSNLVSDNSPKYIGFKDANPPGIWGKWYCKNQEVILGFAGEFDSALSNQDGFPSFSLTNGIGALKTFPDNWPNLWFTNSKKLIVVFDKKEESQAGQLAGQWNKIKGSFTAKILHYPIEFEGKDYSEYREKHTKEDFRQLIKRQLKIDMGERKKIL
jgi:hypothetical protein